MTLVSEIKILVILARIVIMAMNLVESKIRDVVFDLKTLGTFDGNYDRLRAAMLRSCFPQ